MANITGSIADAGRLIHLTKKRERQKEDLEKQRQKIKEESANMAVDFQGKFKAHYDAIEQTLKDSTVGLVSLSEMRQKQEDFVKARELQLAHKKLEEKLRPPTEAELEAEQKKKAEEMQKRRVLSFCPDGEEEDEEEEEEDEAEGSGVLDSPPAFKKAKLGKNPTVDTSFLPDTERELEENRLREALRQEWSEKQEVAKAEEINVAFSYWDGSGHRRDTTMKKGSTIHAFLQKAVEILRKDFHELKNSSAESLMFVKEDLIIPHYHTFHDFIVSKAMGKTGPLFNFDAAGELRVRQDAKTEVAESHPAKVVLRSWYERNKHIYPASRWEPFVPNKKYDTNIEDLSTL